MKAFDIIVIHGLPYTILRVYRVSNKFFTHKTRFTAYCYITNRKIDAALTEGIGRIEN